MFLAFRQRVCQRDDLLAPAELVGSLRAFYTKARGFEAGERVHNERQ
jgi:hypothetical protein